MASEASLQGVTCVRLHDGNVEEKHHQLERGRGLPTQSVQHEHEQHPQTQVAEKQKDEEDHEV